MSIIGDYMTIVNIFANLVFLGILVRYDMLLPEESEQGDHNKKHIFGSKIMIRAMMAVVLWVIMMFLISMVIYWPSPPLQVLLDSPGKMLPLTPLVWLVLGIGTDLDSRK